MDDKQVIYVRRDNDPRGAAILILVTLVASAFALVLMSWA